MTNKFTRNFVLFVAGTSLGFAAMSADKVSFDSPDTEKFVRRIVADVQGKKLMQVDSAALGREYRANEVAADAKYKDKYLFVRATVDSVRRDALNNIVVFIRSDNRFLPNAAQLDKTVAVITGMESDDKTVSMKTLPAADAAGALKTGQKLRMLCKAKGLTVGTVTLDVCDTFSQ